MKYWKKLNSEQLSERIFEGLEQNMNFFEGAALGVPASHLDGKVFSSNASFLKDSPFLSTLIHNPNHIGCHTLGESESFFKGTQDIERELIRICAEDILKADADCDGYVASGGTEANLQAIWMYRNYFIKEKNAEHQNISLLCSEDSHYSMNKAANIFNIKINNIPVTSEGRSLKVRSLKHIVEKNISEGCNNFIVIVNMMTTMFGSVDDINTYIKVLKSYDCNFKIHVDGAYGGFFYPFSTKENELNFQNPYIDSVTLDAHKMVQAPYGTGIFLCRKNLMNYSFTEEAKYVKGLDSTLIGSRSGANAIAVWMILMTYGPHGWHEKIHILLRRGDWLCEQLKNLGITHYRHPYSNIITIKSHHVSTKLAEKYGLVPDAHGEETNWYKIIIMDHVTIDLLSPFIDELEAENPHKKSA